MKNITKEKIEATSIIVTTIASSTFTDHNLFYNKTIMPLINKYKMDFKKKTKASELTPNLHMQAFLRDFLNKHNLDESFDVNEFHVRGRKLSPHFWASIFPKNKENAQVSPQLYVLIEPKYIRFGFDYGTDMDKSEVARVADNPVAMQKVYKILRKHPDIKFYSEVESTVDFTPNLKVIKSIQDVQSNWTKSIHLMKHVPVSSIPGDIEDVIANTLIQLLDLYYYICFNKELGKMNDLIKNLISILSINKQLILTGAPGTGKTHTAKTLSELMTGEAMGSDKYETRVNFVQFHPSYDYTDFIEGIRPTINNLGGTEEIAFELRNGTFKEFCRKAGVIERLIFLFKDDNRKIKTVLEEHINEICRGLPKYVVTFWEDWAEDEPLLSDITCLELSSNLVKLDEFLNKLPPFVFIIDEINRAELSKVLGELMYSLEAGYRGNSGAVKTQYSNLNTQATCFIRPLDDIFFVPKNIYIIGCMNDIDRSVDIFDFALRRRFAWYEVKVDEVMEETLRAMLFDSDYWLEINRFKELLGRIKKLNSFITSPNGLMLGSQFQVGPAYFSKIKNYNEEEAYEFLWDYHLSPLLAEYLRGNRFSEQLLKKCYAKFVSNEAELGVN
ncbi:McrB family protein [Bacillus salipaludis]|uniref:McrB family protein n=1 Tax=Bacillus salipaludis TaxID=2547811 RepID=UPI002E1A660C|nr:AAA family ATPase [Bacillus salipaludis]